MLVEVRLEDGDFVNSSDCLPVPLLFLNSRVDILEQLVPVFRKKGFTAHDL